MILIDSDVVGLRMSPLALVEALRRGHEAEEESVVERVLVEDAKTPSAALTWVSRHPSLGFATKTATIFPRNGERGDKPNLHSAVLLFDAKDGHPLAAIHGESFTRMKTAADSALGVVLLAARAPEKLAVLGAGAQAETQIRFFMAVRPSIQTIEIWNRSPGSADRLAKAFLARGIDCRAVAEPAAAVGGADIVTCVTGSPEPVLGGAWLRPGCHVDLVGAYTPGMREADDEVVRRGRLYADSRRFGVEQCGDYAQPIAAGIISAGDIIGDLYELCSGQAQGRRTAEEITVFKNGGGGHLDLMAAAAFYELARGDGPSRAP